MTSLSKMSERKEKEEQQQSSANLFQWLFEGAPAGAFPDLTQVAIKYYFLK